MSCVWTVVQKTYFMVFHFFHDDKKLVYNLLIIISGALYCKCRSIKVYGRYCLYSVVCMLGMFSELGLIQALFHLVSVLRLHWHGLLRQCTYFWQSDFIYFENHKWHIYVNSTCRYFLLLCILSNCRKKTKYCALELQGSVKGIRE